MAAKVQVKTTFEATKTIEPIYTGGDISGNASGRILATCVDDDIFIIDIETGKPLSRIEGDGEPITSISLSPSASHVVMCSRSLSMRIFRLNTSENPEQLDAELLRTLKPHTTPVVTSAIDSTGTLLATGGAEGTIKVWDIKGGYVTHTFHGHGGLISALRFFQTLAGSSSDHKTQIQRKAKRKSRDSENSVMQDNAAISLGSGGEDGKIRVWNLNTSKPIAVLDSHVSVVKSIEFCERQQVLLSSSRDKTIILWSCTTWKPLKVIPALEVLEAGGFLLGGQYCYSGGENGIIRIWSTSSGREITEKQQAGNENDAIVSVIPAPSMGALVSIHHDQTIRVHSEKSLIDLPPDSTTLPLPVIRRISGNHDEIIDMVLVGPDRSILALATNTESVRLVSARDGNQESGSSSPGTEQFGSDVALLEGHEEIIICLDVDWSGHWLVTGAKDNSARLWRLDPKNSSFTCIASFVGHAESLGAIALPRTAPTSGPSSKDPLNHPPAFLITGSQDKTVKKWDTSKIILPHDSTHPQTNAKALYTRVAHQKDINALDVSPTAPLFASASQDRTIKIWSLDTGAVTGILRGHKRGVWSISFAPAGTNPISLAEGGTSSSHGLIVSGSGDRTVKVWSLSTYTCLLTFEGHSNSVLKVIWLPPQPVSPDAPPHQSQSNPIIASASSDTLIKLWSAHTPPTSDHLLTTLAAHTDRIWALASPPPSQTKTKSASYPLISGAADATITFWTDTTISTLSSATAATSARIEQDQELQNRILAKDYREAIVLSLQLNHPGRLLRLFEEIMIEESEEGSIMNVKAVDTVLAELDTQQLYMLLQRLRDWNTNVKTSGVAQRVLRCLLKSYPGSTFVEMARDRNLRGVRELFRALEVYTERHYKRVEELVDEGFLLEYTLREMDEGIGARNGIGEDHAKGDVVTV